MGKADGGLRKMVQQHLHKGLGWYWTPLETGATHAGVPDSYYAHEPTQTDGWVEHKATRGWAVTIRPHQVAWMEIHLRCNVRCYFLVRAQGGGRTSYWLVHGSAARDLAEHGLRGLPAEAVLGRWQDECVWHELAEILAP